MRRPKFELPAVPGPFPELSGTIPGVLDPVQRSRLLRTPQSTLSFASFDPGIAVSRGLSHLGNLSLNEEDRCRAKRIVIETIPGHGSFWRWVPRARKRDHVFDEGNFPRLVDICGKTYLISQDQWDIYKLDPCYDCFVDDFSRRTVITKKDQTSYEASYSSSVNTSSRESTSQSAPYSSRFSTIDEEDEKMVIDDEDQLISPQSTSKFNAAHKRGSPHFDFTRTASSSSFFEQSKPKRAANVSFQSLRNREEEEDEYFKADSQNRNTINYAPKIQKRARTLSPSSSSRILNNQRIRREKEKQTRWEAKKEARRRYRDQNFLREVFAEVPQSHFQDNGSEPPDITENGEGYRATMDDSLPGINSSTAKSGEVSESERLEQLEESRRKMSELNADRASQRRREQLERGEEPMRRARTEAPRESKQKEAQKLWEESVRQEEERQRRAALLERSERERRSRHEQWENGPWSDVRAFERYKSVSSFFDKARFSEENMPLSWIDIPWPVLLRPSDITPSDITFDTVAQFFLEAKWSIRGSKYKEFLRVSFQRFHPDRWDSRRLLEAIIDDVMREEARTASEVVAKAVSALYDQAKATDT